eukprot:6156621-Amphidinium_carterae.1
MRTLLEQASPPNWCGCPPVFSGLAIVEHIKGCFANLSWIDSDRAGKRALCTADSNTTRQTHP